MTNLPKRRGAPPGNHNALKHGAYSIISKPKSNIATTITPETTLLATGLTHEIDTLRLLIDRISTYSTNETPIQSQIAILNCLSGAIISLASLLRTEIAIGADRGNAIQQAIQQAISTLYEGRYD